MPTLRQIRKWRQKAIKRKARDRYLLKLAKSGKQGEYFNRLNTHFKMKPIGRDDFRTEYSNTHRFKRSKGIITQISRLPRKD